MELAALRAPCLLRRPVASQLVLLRRFGAAHQLGMGEVIDVMIGRRP